ncbi:MAG: LysM domain-containing protein [Acetatifactor sp.]|nr:LysM domain-containing protein [Acetatifactor sp.]
MKKKALALLLGGVMAVGSLSMQVPAAAEAMTSDECDYYSEKHIKSYEVTTVDGQLAVTIDIEEFETRTSNGGVTLYAFEKQLEKQTNDWGGEDYPVYEQRGWSGELDIDKSGTYVFDGLTSGKTYYVYAIAYDLHGLQPSEDSGQHYAAYLGSGKLPGKVFTLEECDGSYADKHITSSEVTAIDGKLAVTIDLALEHENSYFALYVFDEQLKERSDGFAGIYDPVSGGIVFRDDLPFYPLFLETPVVSKDIYEGSGTYILTELPADKTYYVYCIVYDHHEAMGEGEWGEDAVYTHWAAYLGSSSSGSQGGGSANTPSGSASYNPFKEAETAIIGQIKTAEAGSTVVMDKGTTTLSNSIMKELLKKGDVSLKLEFTYNEQEYVIVIPAGAALDNDIPWYGPLYLAQQYGNSAGNAASEAGGVYEVKRGDTLSKIAAANNMTLKQLLTKNPQIKDANKIVVGEKINR